MLNPAKLRSRRGRWPVGGGVSVIFHTQARHLHSFPSSWHICVGVSFSFTFRLRRQSHWNVFSFRWGLTTPCPLDLFLIFNCFGEPFLQNSPSSTRSLCVCAALMKGPPTANETECVWFRSAQSLTARRFTKRNANLNDREAASLCICVQCRLFNPNFENYTERAEQRSYPPRWRWINWSHHVRMLTGGTGEKCKTGHARFWPLAQTPIPRPFWCLFEYWIWNNYLCHLI